MSRQQDSESGRRTKGMRQSAEVRDAMLRFYDRLSAGDVESFEELVSQEATLIIGTAPGEWVTERDRMRFGFEAEGVRLQAGDNPAGYEEGSLGWFVDEPSFILSGRFGDEYAAYSCRAPGR
jgi:SnoaL-like domain